MSWHSTGYPGRLALALSPLDHERAAFLSRLTEDWLAHQEAVLLARQDKWFLGTSRASLSA
eukprot:10608482-Lingulodinium_polyedra.AAC.1